MASSRPSEPVPVPVQSSRTRAPSLGAVSSDGPSSLAGSLTPSASPGVGSHGGWGGRASVAEGPFEHSSSGVRDGEGGGTSYSSSQIARQPPSTSGSLQQYYLAVDRLDFKMATLVDLLEVLRARTNLPLAISCSSRDTLDAIFAAVSAAHCFRFECLHSDMSESERATVLESFRATSMRWWKTGGGEGGGAPPPSKPAAPPGTTPPTQDDSKDADVAQSRARAHILAVTDACLPSQALGEQPLSARLLINYDLPVKKEGYIRRAGACLGHASAAAISRVGTLHRDPSFSSPSGGASTATGGGIIINFVVAGDVSALRHLEESCGFVVEEMPINISELL